MMYNDIIRAFYEHLRKSTKNNWSDFYVGITDDIEVRLHGFHKVPKKGYWYIHCHADSEEIARNVERFFLNKGMDGGTGGGDDDTKYVYCYEIGPNTKER